MGKPSTNLTEIVGYAPCLRSGSRLLLHCSSIAESSTVLWKQFKRWSFRQMAYNQEILISTRDYFKWIWPLAQTVAMGLYPNICYFTETIICQL